MGGVVSAVHILSHPRSAPLKDYAWLIKRLSFLQVVIVALDILLFFLQGDSWQYLGAAALATIVAAAGFLTAFTLWPLTGFLYLLVLLVRLAVYCGLVVWEALDGSQPAFVYGVQGVTIALACVYLLVSVFYVLRLYDPREPDGHSDGYDIVPTEEP